MCGVVFSLFVCFYHFGKKPFNGCGTAAIQLFIIIQIYRKNKEKGAICNKIIIVWEVARRVRGEKRKKGKKVKKLVNKTTKQKKIKAVAALD